MLLTEQCLHFKLHLSVRITVPRIGFFCRNKIVFIPKAAKYVNAAGTLSDLYTRFQVFNELIDTYSEKAIVSSINKSGQGFKLNCAYEDKLIYNYFHKKTTFYIKSYHFFINNFICVLNVLTFNCLYFF